MLLMISAISFWAFRGYSLYALLSLLFNGLHTMQLHNTLIDERDKLP